MGALDTKSVARKCLTQGGEAWSEPHPRPHVGHGNNCVFADESIR